MSPLNERMKNICGRREWSTTGH